MSLGGWPSEPLGPTCDLQSIEAEPIASASLAQVHQAVLRDGTKVAVMLGVGDGRCWKGLEGDGWWNWQDMICFSRPP